MRAASKLSQIKVMPNSKRERDFWMMVRWSYGNGWVKDGPSEINGQRAGSRNSFPHWATLEPPDKLVPQAVRCNEGHLVE